MKIKVNTYELPDRGLKRWGKHLVNVDPSVQSGYGFEGEWLNKGKDRSVPVGDFVLWYFESGNPDSPVRNVILYQAESTGLVEVRRWEQLPTKWAGEIIEDVAEEISDPVPDTRGAVGELRRLLNSETSRDIGGGLIECYRRLVNNGSPGLVGARDMLGALLASAVGPFSDHTEGSIQRLLIRAEAEFTEE